MSLDGIHFDSFARKHGARNVEHPQHFLRYMWTNDDNACSTKREAIFLVPKKSRVFFG